MKSKGKNSGFVEKIIFSYSVEKGGKVIQKRMFYHPKTKKKIRFQQPRKQMDSTPKSSWNKPLFSLFSTPGKRETEAISSRFSTGVKNVVEN